ncbi:hypothetical protein J437_LFUL011894 [Ladona fulva]|uniref:C2H2-type domain-containing protein n=1 Tax=Ladona fulva TaxID=123851 RepID=A0A8K0KDX0_LADFU|nr:hypothetical protein J437_LFUL011894 [Ladona fulva]
MEDTQGPLFVKQPDTSSKNCLYREVSSTNGIDCNPNQGISKQLEENNLKERNGLSHFNNTVSSSMFSFPLSYLVQLSLQGHIQSNNYLGMVAQNRGSSMHQMERRKECKSSIVKEILVRGGVRNSTVNGIELGRKERENIRGDGIEVGKNEEKTTSVQYFCKECCKIFISTDELDNHSCERLVVKNVDCKECGKKFKTEKILWYHKRIHNLNMPFYCQICGKGFLREDDLSMHLFSHENNSPLQAFAASSPRSSIPSGGTVSDVGQIQNNCDLEKEQVKNRQKRSKTVKACPVCHRDYSCANSLKRHMLAQHSEKNFQCNLCPKKFQTEKGAECHSRRHRKNRPYHCEVCGVGFYREVFLLKHISIHAKDEPFQCDLCGKKYNHKRLLWTHIAQCYKRKSNECNICNKRFHCEAYLSVHKTIHTGEKNLMCEVCGKTFRGSSALAVHRRQHTGEKPYCCDICDRRFTQRVSLVTHNKRYHA